MKFKKKSGLLGREIRILLTWLSKKFKNNIENNIVSFVTNIENKGGLE